MLSDWDADLAMLKLVEPDDSGVGHGPGPCQPQSGMRRRGRRSRLAPISTLPFVFRQSAHAMPQSLEPGPRLHTKIPSRFCALFFDEGLVVSQASTLAW